MQLGLMRDLVGGKITGPEFARAWLTARRRALDEGERVGEKFDRALTDVFYMLDDYVIDPSLRGPSDMADEELVGKVRDALSDLEALDASRGHNDRSSGP
jgi:hypothetical protein